MRRVAARLTAAGDTLYGPVLALVIVWFNVCCDEHNFGRIYCSGSGWRALDVAAPLTTSDELLQRYRGSCTAQASAWAGRSVRSSVRQ